MDWMGIGLVIIAIAFSVLVLLLVKPLLKLSGLLVSMQKSTDRLPVLLDNVTKQTADILHLSNETLENVNKQVTAITPVFHMISDAGTESRQFTSATLEKVYAFKQRTAYANSFKDLRKYEGIYGLMTFIYILSQNKNKIKSALPNNSN